MATRREFMGWSAAAIAAPNAIEAQSPAPREPRDETAASHVGTVYPLVRSQVPAVPPALTFLRHRGSDVAAWKRKARRKLLELLHYAPVRCAPRAEIVSRADRDGYTLERVVFSTTPDIRVPANVLIPTRAALPAPGIVALHDHGAFYMWGKEKLVEQDDEHPALTAHKRQSYAGLSVASEMARRGYVVIAIDMFYWGERRMLLDTDPEDWRLRQATMPVDRVTAFHQRASQYENLVARTIGTAGFTWPGVMLWDDIRTVDYLLTRPEVDPKRIGCVGLSVGGFRSAHLAALHDRIRAAVVVGWMTSFPHQLRDRIVNTIGHTMLIPGLYKHLDYPDVASLAMPAPLLVINGSRDTLFTAEGVREAHRVLSACYERAGVGERVRTRVYDAPHEFNREMQAEAWEWLDRWI